MDRREFNSLWVPALMVGMTAMNGNAATWQDLTQSEALQGMKEALRKGAASAVSQLGRRNGFWGNERVRIELPAQLQDAANWMRKLGQGDKVDDLVHTMNQAAEEAVPMAASMLEAAVRGMSAADAKKILQGGETSVTEFFAEKTRRPLGKKFEPIIKKTTQKHDLASKYNDVAGRAAGLGLVRQEDARIEDYVGRKALDGLYFMIGEEERKIRRNPVGAGSALLSKVFGNIR
ncbi:MAG: DUF4197 domain-containing protein [Hylemonella sp.]|nr:DUF4197 domain-containing protein [Hylemonella sp.]MDH5708536.1 DUF4197 domain-containing protein [Hylemonella sp.]